MFKTFKILILFLLINPVYNFGQSNQIDSLLKVLYDQEDTIRMKSLRHIVDYYMDNSVEEAIKYASELLMISEEKGNLKFIDLASSFLGEAYFYMDEIDKSIEYFEKFLETNIKQDDIEGIATAYNNLGIVYRHIEKYEIAIQYYLESLSIKERLKDSTGLSSTLNNIGVLYFHMGDYNKALEYYKNSYAIETSIGHKPGIATSLLNIGEIYSMLNKYDKALSNFNRSIEIAENIGNMHTLEINYKCLYDMYKRKIDFQKSLYYFELYNDLRNKRLSQESRREIAELEIQYETSKKEKEIDLLYKQNLLNKTIIIGLSIAFGIIIFLLLLVYFQGREKKKALKLLSKKNEKITEQTQKLNKLNNTKDKFFSIISHDLKGAIGGFLTQTNFLAQDFKELTIEDTHDLILKMNQSSKQLYSLLENLLEWSKSQTSNIKIHPEKFKLKKLIESILPLFNELMQEKKIKANVVISNDKEVFADINMISTVFRNLIVNAIKFSHPGSSFYIGATEENGCIKVEIADQGIGISKKDLEKLFKIDQSFSNPGTNQEKGTGLGLILCKEFIELNQGKIWAESHPGNGSRFMFTLKSV